MKLLGLGIIGGVIGAILGCQVVGHAQASASSKWDGCSQRMVYAGEHMVRVHDCN